MPTSIQEALKGQTPIDLARRAGFHYSVASRLIAGKQQFISAEVAGKIQAVTGIDLSGFVRKPDQKIPRAKHWSLAAKRRLRRSRAAKRAWAEKKQNGSAVEKEITLMAVRYSKHFCFVINKDKGTVLGKAIIMNPEEM